MNWFVWLLAVFLYTANGLSAVINTIMADDMEVLDEVPAWQAIGALIAIFALWWWWNTVVVVLTCANVVGRRAQHRKSLR